MGDIRRIAMDERGGKHITAVPYEKFKLGEERRKELEELLPQMINWSYWSPKYQAFEPFIFAYLQSGIAADLAAKWASKFSDKIVELGPPVSGCNKIMSEIVRMGRVKRSECFADYTWDEIQQFVEYIPKYIDSRPQLYKLLFNGDRYNALLNGLVDAIDVDSDDKYTYLIAAVYLYRHCMLDYNPVSDEVKAKLQQGLNDYSAQFEAAFNSMEGFIGDDNDVYRWYTPKVCSVIKHAWESSLDLTDKRSVITASDVFNLPVWVSEQLTDYVNSLPCVYTVPVTPVFILDALESMSGEPRYMYDLIYPFCIPKSYLKSCLDRLSQFYWDVKEGIFVEQLRALYRAAYAEADVSEGVPMTPEEYDVNLVERGFPVPGITVHDDSDESALDDEGPGTNLDADQDSIDTTDKKPKQSPGKVSLLDLGNFGGGK